MSEIIPSFPVIIESGGESSRVPSSENDMNLIAQKKVQNNRRAFRLRR